MKSFPTLKKCLKGKVRFSEPLAKHTTFRIGGPAKIWIEPKGVEDLKKILEFSKRNRLKYLVIGNGSNILADDKGFNGVIIRLSSPYFREMNVKGTRVIAGAGAALSNLIRTCCKKSLAGLEGLIGIPGTLGGALCLNAGYKTNIGDFVTKVRIMDKTGKTKTLKKKDLKFGYRTSNLSRYILINAELKLKKDDRAYLEKLCSHLLKLKKNKQPWYGRSAGCVFKNPKKKNISAGELIDRCGLKGERIGGAKVSEKHANFIVNINRAKSKDVKLLIDKVKKNVRKKFKVEHEPEIIIL